MVTQTEINIWPTLQKLQSMFKIQEMVKTANEALALAEILKDKDLNLTEINHHINAAATVITEDGNGTGSYKSETHSPKTPPWARRIQDSINGITKDLSTLREIKRDEMKIEYKKIIQEI